MRFSLGIGKMKSSNQFEYFYYFLLSSLLIIVVLGGVLYFYFSSVLRNEAFKANGNMLEQLKNAQEVILAEMDKSIAGIVLDPFFNNYMDYYFAQDRIMLMATQEKIDKTVTLNDYIDSVFIYFLNEKMVLSSDQGTEGVDSFYDREFLKGLKSENFKGDEVYSRTKINFHSNMAIHTLSFIKPIPLNYSGTPKAIVVFNMKGFYLQQLMNSMKINPLANIIITDQDGKIISQKKEEVNIHICGVSTEFNVQKFDKTGSVIQDQNNGRMLVSYVHSDKYKWNYIYTIPMASVTSSIRVLGVVTVIFCILMALLSVAGSFILSRRIYSPIRSILNLIGKYEEGVPVSGESRSNQKETLLIEKNISGLIDRNKTLDDKNRSLQAVVKEYELYQKNMFLQSLLEGNFEDGKKLEDELQYYGFDLYTSGYFCTFVISMDKYADFLREYSVKQKNMLFIYIRDNIGNAIFNRYKGFIVEAASNETVIVVNFDDSSNLEDLKNIRDSLAKTFHTLVSEGFKYTFTIGVSTVQKGIARLPNCFNEGIFALNHRLILGYNSVIPFDGISVKAENKFAYPFNIERNIANCLKAGERKGVLVALEDFKQYIYENPSENSDFVRHYFLQLLSSSLKCLNEIGRNLEGEHFSYTEIYMNVLKEETLDGMASHLRSLYESVLQYSEEQRNSKSKELMEEVRKFILSRPGEDLSIERIAEQFSISSSYLRKLFKDETGVTVKEYIDRVRMEKAKELLEDPNCKIQDIAEKVGYISVSAFTRVFRQETGLTPGEYRKQLPGGGYTSEERRNYERG